MYHRSKAFYTWCEEQNLETLKQYIEHSKDTVAHFLRGLYDSEGCNYRCRRIYLSNSDLKLLKYVQYLLKKYFDIIATGPYLHAMAGNIHTKRNGEKVKAKKNNYYIAISSKKYVQSFLNGIGFSIVRRQLGLKKHEKVLVNGKYVEPFKLVKIGLFKLPFSDSQ